MVETTNLRWRRFLGAYGLAIAGDRWFDAALPALSLWLLGDLQATALHLWSFGCSRLLVSWGVSKWVARRPSYPWLGLSNLLTAVAMVGLGLIFVSEVIPILIKSGVVIAGLLLGMGAAIQNLVFGATLKAVVVSTWLGRAQAQLEIVDCLISFVAPLLATCLLLTAHPGFALLASGGLYLVVAAMRWSHLVVSAPDPNPGVMPCVQWFGIPFVGAERRYISVSLLTATLLTLMTIPIASARLNSIGLSPGLSGIVVAATSMGSIPAALIAGRLSNRVSQFKLVLAAPLVCALFLLIGLHLSADLLVTLFFAAVFDACVCWVFVIALTARTRGEDSLDLVRISAGMSIFGALVSGVVGVMLLGVVDRLGQLIVLFSCSAAVGFCCLQITSLPSLADGCELSEV